MKKLALLLFPLFLLLVPPVCAQTIHGVVIEDSTRMPISGVRVELLNARGAIAAAAYSDTAGAFFLHPNKPDRFQLRLTHPGWVAPRPVPVALSEHDIIGVELRMSRSVVMLEPLVVTSKRDPRLAGFYDRATSQSGSGQYVTRKQIESHPSARTTDILRNLAGIEIMQTGRGVVGRTQIVTMRGGWGLCQPTIYIDGIIVRQMPGSGLDEFLAPAFLEGIEVYTRTATGPATLPSRNACGVIAFWTRLEPVQGRSWSWLRAASTVGVFALFLAVVR